MPGTTETRTEADGSTRATAGDAAGAAPAAALVVSLLALLAAPWLAWQADVGGWGELTSAHAALGETVAVGALVPTIVLWALVLAQLTWGRRHPLTLRLAELVTLVGVGFLLYAALQPPNDQTAPGIGMGLAVFAYPVAMVSGATLDLLGIRGRPQASWAALATVVVLGAGVGAGGVWFATGLIVDSSTMRATPAGVPEHVAPGTVVWSQSLADDDPDGPAVAPLTDGLVALRTQPGLVMVRDLATGVTRWHYGRSGVAQGGIEASQDGRTLLVDFLSRQRDLVIAFDAATGHIRWQRWQPDGTSTFLLPTAVLTVHPDHVYAYGTQATADDPATGRRLWSQSLGAWCHQHSALAGAGSTTVVLTPCHTDERTPARSDLGVRAIGATGHVRWQADTTRGLPVDVSGIDVVDPRIVAVRGPLDYAVYSTGTGRLLFRSVDRPLASDANHVVSAAADDEADVRDLATNTTRRVQVGGPVLAGDIRDGQAYLVIDTPDASPLQLERVNLATAKVTGIWPLSQRFTTLYDLASVQVNAGNGVVLVSGLTYGIQSDTVAVRVP